MNAMRRPAPFVLAILSGWLGCAKPAAPARLSEQSLPLAFSGLRRAVEAGTPACGTPSASATRLVFLTARECLGCRDVGHMLRELVKRTPAAETVAIGVPDSDTGLVCGFVREEHVTAPVIGIPARGQDDELNHSTLISYARLINGVIVDSAVAPDGEMLLTILQARGDISSQSAAQP